jgi:hypothetical protein
VTAAASGTLARVLDHDTVTRYVTPLREGGSLPALVEADNLGTYVMKFHCSASWCASCSGSSVVIPEQQDAIVRVEHDHPPGPPEPGFPE